MPIAVFYKSLDSASCRLWFLKFSAFGVLPIEKSLIKQHSAFCRTLFLQNPDFGVMPKRKYAAMLRHRAKQLDCFAVLSRNDEFLLFSMTNDAVLHIFIKKAGAKLSCAGFCQKTYLLGLKLTVRRMSPKTPAAVTPAPAP